ncbi:MAG: hypothetical protein FWD44_07690 [Oscillospiraceae bacterium]|nr:hypothetical protein [Oscillospiraceae bacterium]
MDERVENVNFEEVLENEVDDIWDIFFPYMTEKKEALTKLGDTEQTKPRRYLRFLTMCF